MEAIKDIDLRKVGDSCGDCGGNLSEMYVNGEKVEYAMICEYCNDGDEITAEAEEYINEKNKR